MHGRLKVKSTAEQLEAKQKEREKKLQLYNGATSKIFSKKRNGELDEELLLLTSEVLAVNPDFYTLWNYRKETFLELLKTKSKDELQKIFQSELYFLESCMKVNHKSYGTWNHRRFVLETMPEPDWCRELELCNQFLKYDERNFHCWDFRRFVAKKANISPESELEFSLSKISNNFSNYSSWHYRSKLLPVVFPDSSQPMGVSEEALLKEIELVRNGIFTDPDDQSNWFYHRWLMGRGEQRKGINSFIVSRLDKSAIISFTGCVKISKTTDIIVECNSLRLESLQWHNPNRDSFYSTIWISENMCLPSEDCCIKASLYENNSKVCSLELHLSKHEDSQHVSSSSSSSTSAGSSQFRQELSAVKSETLQEELESISQLLEMETDNKWIILTIVLLMKALDPIKYATEIMNNLDKLEALDFKRANYYKDLRSKFIIENIIDSANGSTISSVDLRDKCLTKLYHTELLPLLTFLDVSGNQLKDVQNFNFLRSLAELRLNGNSITSCQGLQFMPNLEKLFLNDNCISLTSGLESLQSCPSLKYLNISGNPICESEGSIEGLKELLPDVEIILKS